MNIDELILNKKFSELTEKERNFVLEEMSEEAYNSLQFAIQLKQKEVVAISPGLKSTLISDFKSKNVVPTKSWWASLSAFLFPAEKSFVLKPGVQLAFASVVLILGGTWLFNSGALNSQESLVAKVEESSMVDTQELKEVSVEEVDSNKGGVVSEKNFEIAMDSTFMDSKKGAELMFSTTISPGSDADLVDAVDEEVMEMEDKIFEENTMAAGMFSSPRKLDLPASNSSVSVEDEPDLLDLLSAVY